MSGFSDWWKTYTRPRGIDEMSVRKAVYEAGASSLRQQVADLRGENNALKCQIEGDHCAMCPDVKRLREAFKQIELLCEQYDEPVSMILGVTHKALSGKGEL